MWLLVLAAGLLAAGFFSMTWRTGDDARYFGTARALVEGRGYTQAFLPDAPPETLTPPAQPLWLALVMLLFGAGVGPAKVFGSLMFVAGCVAVFAWAYRAGGQRRLLAWLVTAASMFTSGILTMSCWYMVEMTFIAFSFLTLAVAEREEATWSWKRALAIGMLAGYVYLVRATGLALLAAGGLVLLPRRRWAPLLVFGLGFVLVAAPWTVRSLVLTGHADAYVGFEANLVGHDGGGSYPWLRIPADIANAFPVYFVRFVPANLLYRFWGEDGVLSWLRLGFLALPLQWLLLAALLTGFVADLLRWRFRALYFLFYWLIICSPPFPPQGHWYIYPVLPLAAWYTATGFGLWVVVIQRARRAAAAPDRLRWALLPAAWLAVYTLATAGYGAAVQFSRERGRAGMAPWAPERYFTYKNEYFDAWGRMVEAAFWVASNMPPDTLVASRAPAHVYLITGRQGWRYDAGFLPGMDLWGHLSALSEDRPVALVEDAFKVYEGTSFSYGGGHWAFRALFDSHRDDLVLAHETEAPVTRVWTLRREPDGVAPEK
ncbi:MAG: hypothetical protein KA248_01385 [Kiritimatiellae bacterium]|nr:hypothetical protein [Kiritimatiellia bacterium]